MFRFTYQLTCWECSYNQEDLGDSAHGFSGALNELVGVLKDFQPTIVMTHNPLDPFNPDHPVTSMVSVV